MKIFNKDIEILGDDEGFIIFECPYCKSEFKVSAYDLQNKSIYNELFCPYCGLTKDIKYFYTKEIKAKATNVGKANYKTKGNILEISNLNLNKGAKLYSSKSLDITFSNIEKQIEKDKPLYKIKMDNKKLEKVNIDRLQGKDLNEISYQCSICDSSEKLLSDGKTIFYCAYCGVSL